MKDIKSTNIVLQVWNFKIPYTITENNIYKLIVEHRMKGRKVSMNFIQIIACKRMKVTAR